MPTGKGVDWSVVVFFAEAKAGEDAPHSGFILKTAPFFKIPLEAVVLFHYPAVLVGRGVKGCQLLFQVMDRLFFSMQVGKDGIKLCPDVVLTI